MARALGIAAPAGGLTAGVAALALWTSAISMRWRDGVVALLFTVGLALALAGCFRGANTRTRRLGVVATGWNAFGLAALLVLYALG